MNERQWRKAYMIEFLENNVVGECFTFSLPPESETIDSSQRVTETKTFGGSIFDEYGPDSVKIKLTGSTVNEERKLIYRGNKKPPSYFTGEKEIFELQKIFDEWGALDKIPNKSVYLYDLSKMSLLQIGAGTPTARNYWRIVNKSLKIRRSKEKPMTFNYELDLIGVLDDEHKLDPLFSSGFGNVLDTCQKVVEQIQSIYETAENVTNVIDSCMNGIIEVRNTFDTIANPKGLKLVDAIFDRPLRIISGGSNSSIYNSCKSLMAFVSKLQNLTGTSQSEKKGESNYSRSDKFTVSFNSSPGSYITPIEVSYGNTIKQPSDPVLQKYTFEGWFKDNAYEEEFDFTTEEITKNVTLYAKWEQVQATVTFNSRQGTTVQPQTVDIGETATVPDPAPTRNGYAFEYWCSDSLAIVEFNFSNIISSDITLYAKWRTIYTVTFNSNGGSSIKSQTVNVGGKVIYPIIPTRENYMFGMWCSDSLLTTEYDFNDPVNRHTTVYAKWTRVSNNVTFNSNGGSTVQLQIIDTGGYAAKPDDPTREGYTFQRWCSDEGLTQEFIFTSIPVNYPITLYAKWDINVYTVSFEGNGGSETIAQDIHFGNLVIYPPIPTKAGALFRRWCTDAGLSMEFDFSTPVSFDLTLYADWY